MAPSLPSSSTTTTTTTTIMPPPTPTLTLIVAATSRTMGIGLNGHLPWPPLKKEMAYFARITKHPPPSPPPTFPSTPTTTRTPLNAVLMGRKTWQSIPPRFRPLAGRINVVISRNPESLELEASQTTQMQSKGQGTPVLAAGSIRDALDTLRTRYGEAVGHVFVIGGAEIYRAAMGMRETRRVLLTRVRTEFECDTFFPVGLGGAGDGGGDEEWVERGREGMREFVGAEGIVPEGVVTEGGVRWEVELWERRGWD